VQFSIRSLLIAMTIVAVAVVVLPASNFLSWVLYGLVSVGLPVCMVTGAVYARGQKQTFFLGAACGAFAPSFPVEIALGLRGAADPLLALFLEVVLCAGAGALAISIRRLIERRGWHVPPESPRSGD
jgi:hypothetical protein